MRICVAGAGYVGLVVGTCLSESGNDVVCVDSDESKIEALSAGTPTIYEPGLSDYLARNLKEGRLAFSTDLASAVAGAEIVFIAVGTPTDSEKRPDMSSVWEVARVIGESLTGYTVIAVKSTVPVGTAARLKEMISGLTEHEFSVVSNPEFLKEGTAVADFMKPERVIVGTDPSDARVGDIIGELYDPFLRTGKPLLRMSNTSAEICKYACNGLLATKISFMNEIAGLCAATGGDVSEVRMGMGTDPRIGPQFLFPGVGYGGSCFPKDVAALVATASERGAPMDILRSVSEVNERQKRLLVKLIRSHFGENLSGRKGAIWGLSFKPRTDDVREAPSLAVIGGLLDAGAALSVFDPVAMDNARAILRDRVEYVRTNYDALDGADFLAVVTEWNEFRRPDFERVKKLMRQPVVFDGRNIYSRKRMERMGFTYYGIGL
jgi:UDPglucose 6-dehydrogenase